MTIRRSIAVAVTAASLLAVPAFAKVHRSKCEQKVRNAEAKLHQAIRKHGEHSRQAEEKREALEHVRATCHR